LPLPRVVVSRQISLFFKKLPPIRVNVSARHTDCHHKTRIRLPALLQQQTEIHFKIMPYYYNRNGNKKIEAFQNKNRRTLHSPVKHENTSYLRKYYFPFASSIWLRQRFNVLAKACCCQSVFSVSTVSISLL